MPGYRKFILTMTAMVLGLTVSMTIAQKPATAEKDAPLPGVWAKLDQTLDTSYTKAGDKISAVLQQETSVKGTTLPKGSKLTGTVLRSVKKDKQHKNAGVVLAFDSAVLKNGSTVPVHVTVASLAPSRTDEIEKVDVGSGDITDATLYADVAAGRMDDPNGGASADSGTRVNGVRATSSIKGVVLFAVPSGNASGVVVARTGPLQLDKWTRLNVIVTPR